MGKRRRCNAPGWWDALKVEIQSNGGFLHPSLRFSNDSRQLAVDDFLIEKDTLILQIPEATLITTDRALEMLPWWKSIEKKIVQSSDGCFSPLSDILLALALAGETKEKLPYLGTLPGSSSFDALPRRWSDDEIEQRLKGSPLLERVKRAKRGVQEDFEKIQKLWEYACADEVNATFPTMSRYSDMLAVVSSRAFFLDKANGITKYQNTKAGSSSKGSYVGESVIGLVPILDLCNHSRGRKETKNLSYEFREGSMWVRSSQPIKAQETLRLTYGARGNSQLLLNYGFTIPSNLEPDGSSNDILEFRSPLPGHQAPVILLRTGPKSYTYGSFVKSLECFIMDRSNDVMAQEGHEDDMENYVNDNDFHGDDEDEAIDIYSDSSINCMGKDDMDFERELEGLEAFRDAIEERWHAYAVDSAALRKRLAAPTPSADYYCSVLVQSERRTLDFFARTIVMISNKLKKGENKVIKTSTNLLDSMSEDSGLMEAQAYDLACAYMKIRHCC